MTITTAQTSLLPVNLMHALADTFGMNLHRKDKIIRGCRPTEFKLGPFTLASDVTLCVDEKTDKLLTAFVRIRKNLWVYTVISQEGRWLMFFDNDKVKIRVGAEKEFGHGNGMGTLTRLKAAITGALSWDGKAWQNADPQELIAGL